MDCKKFIKHHNITPVSSLPDILTKYPHGLNGQPWNMRKLSAYLPGSFLEKNPAGLNGKPWNMFELPSNPNLSWSF